ncbi:transmembrane emp24 domain-containing protein 5 [Drosophila grimshawi]|uniref:GH11207 n=1 Tax=Drosophila grimshawi TaxID=7222 RepID=B4JDK9_DROGR|nr:transmembrane emp24 domain-containing protein 5 [Drosophila grimshawi]EDW03379.1 GH11207 [Drosophila grimshawi]
MFQIAKYCIRFWLLPLLLLLLTMPPGGNSEVFRHRLTVFAEAARMECFHQPVAATETIILEYQVIDGGQGEAHINFILMDPHRRLLVTDHKQSNSKHRMDANETGIYKLCFDNTISTFNQKTVTFYLEIAAGNQEELDRQALIKEMTTDYHFDRSYTHMHDYVGKINLNMMRSRQTQDYIRTLEARDRKLAESNFALVNIWSSVQLVAMIFVGLLQVFMLRSIFNPEGKFNKLWNKLQNRNVFR